MKGLHHGNNNSPQLDPEKKFTRWVIFAGLAIVGALVFLSSSASQKLLGIQVNPLAGYAYKNANPGLSASIDCNAYGTCPNPVIEDLPAVYSPSAKAVWNTGEKYSIKWTLGFLPPSFAAYKVNITLQKPEPACLYQSPPCAIRQIAPYIVATDQPNNGSFDWTIPADLVDAFLGESKIVISLVDTETRVASESFSIERSGSNSGITVNSPAGGERWKLGQKYKITWSDPTVSVRATTVKISFAPTPMGCGPSDGIHACDPVYFPPFVITANAPNNGSYVWNVPRDLTGQYVTSGNIIVAVNDSQLSGNSAQFKIEEDAPSGNSVFSPTAGEEWKLGQVYKIGWNLPDPTMQSTSARLRNVSILLAPPRAACLDQAPYCKIAEPVPYIISETAPNSGTFEWKIPTNLPAMYREAQQITVRLNGTDIYARSQVFKMVAGPSTFDDPKITTTSMSEGRVGDSYSFQFSVAGGRPSYTWTVSAPQLLGVSKIDIGNGTFSAKLVRTDSYRIVVSVRDKLGKIDKKEFTLKVSPEIASAHAHGKLVYGLSNIPTSGWLIENGKRRPFPSAEVFMSHGYKWTSFVPGNTGDEALPIGTGFYLAPGTLVADSSGPDAGKVYVIYPGNVKRAFTSVAVFTGMGYSFSNVYNHSLAAYTEGPIIDRIIAHPPGTDIVKNGTIYYRTIKGRQPYPSVEVYNTWHTNNNDFSKVVPANEQDMNMLLERPVSPRTVGQ